MRTCKWLTGLAFAAGLMAQAPSPAPPPPDMAPREADRTREPGLYATLNTTMGPITVQLFEKETPLTVRNFVALVRGTKAWPDPKTGQPVKRPLYNGITFHRVLPNFMIQTGDPTATGSYFPGFTVKDEFVPTLKFDVPGRLGMANTGQPNTGNCQFFITEVPTPHLNGKHTIFGQVIEGQEVVNKIAHVSTAAGGKPVTPVRISSITLKREGPAPAAPAAVNRAAPSVRKAAPGAKKAAPKK